MLRIVKGPSGCPPLFPSVVQWSLSLPKRNFGFEKRQKELNRQRKQEEKKQRKLDRGNSAPNDTVEGVAPDAAGGMPDERESPDET